MSHLTIITYKTGETKRLSTTEKSIVSQSFRDFEWLVLDKDEKAQINNNEFLLFLKPGEKLFNKNVLQTILNQEHSEDIVFGNAKKNGFLGAQKVLGPQSDDISFFYMMEHPIPLSAAFIRRSLIGDSSIASSFVEPTHWLEFLLSKFFLDNCTLKYTDCIISSTTVAAYKTMFNIDTARQEEIIQTIMPRLINSKNRLYSQSETYEALRLFSFLQRNKVALLFYNRFIKPKGGLDA